MFQRRLLLSLSLILLSAIQPSFGLTLVQRSSAPDATKQSGERERPEPPGASSLPSVRSLTLPVLYPSSALQFNLSARLAAIEKAVEEKRQELNVPGVSLV